MMQLIHTRTSETLATQTTTTKARMKSGEGSFYSLTRRSKAQKLLVTFALEFI